MTEKTNLGIESRGGSIRWRSLNKNKDVDPVGITLLKDAENLIKNNWDDSEQTLNDSSTLPFTAYSDSFDNFLKNKKLPIFFTKSEKDETKKEGNGLKYSKEKKDNKSGKEKKLSKAELIIQENKEKKLKAEINAFLETLDTPSCIPIAKKNPKESLLNIIYWALNLIHKKSISDGQVNSTNLDINQYIDCAISLYRSIEDSKFFLEPKLVTISQNIVSQLQDKIFLKKSIKSVCDIIITSSELISNCFWDKAKPKPIHLYQEQKEVLSTISQKLDSNEPLLLIYKLPPASGKTLISICVSKVISNYNETYEELPKKTLLYICYSENVRDEVSHLCKSNNIKFWFATRKQDKWENNKLKTYLRPYMNCYIDWRKPMDPKINNLEYMKNMKDFKYSEHLREQWEYYLNDVRPNNEKYNEVYDYERANIPEMIISDLESAYTLMKDFPNTFIPFFDETFAAANLNITAQIMSVLPKMSLLVSATLAEPSEIPIVINDFKTRHNLEDDTFIKIVKSDKQHISCTFIEPGGNVFIPHSLVKDVSDLPEYMILLKSDPLIQRAYSPDVVFPMCFTAADNLPEELKPQLRFPFLGILTHESIRNYAFDILNHCSISQDQELFEKVKNVVIKKFDNMEVKNMFSSNAVHYHQHKTLHVASSINFSAHVEGISQLFLSGSPRVSDIISTYERTKISLENQLKTQEKNCKPDSNGRKYELEAVQNELGNLRIQYPLEYLINSLAHASRFNTVSKLKNPNRDILTDVECINNLDDTRAKLFVSGIGIYHPEINTDSQAENFLDNKDKFKFILSTPAIVYGTNIPLTIVDIDSSFSGETTKNMLYQLIGRAGRKGKSHSANIILRDWSMIYKILQKDEINVEALDLERNYKAFLNIK
jgi:hypothetical protein